MDILTDQDMDKYITGSQADKPTGTVSTEDMEKWERGTRKAQSVSELENPQWHILEDLLQLRKPGRNFNLSTNQREQSPLYTSAGNSFEHSATKAMT
jgi:hypothetical protein